MSQFLQPTIILLKDGTDTSQGVPQIISNINACSIVGDIVRTTLGPRGMDKLIYEGNNKAIISNDGATILRQLDIVHPAARTLVDIAKSQDEEVGDGTTSVVVLAVEILNLCKSFVEEGIHSQIIQRGLRRACTLSKQKIRELSVKLNNKDAAEKRSLLEKCAATSLNSKLIADQSAFFSKMAVDAVLKLEDDLDLNMVGIKKEQGGSVQDSMYIEGVAFKKTFSYAGFEQQPKSFNTPKILLLNVELELKREKENAEVRVESTEEYQRIVDAEWKIIYEKLENCVKTGAQIVLSRLAIGDLGTQYFADRGIFCAGRVPDEDLKRVSKATGASIQTTTNNLTEKILGTCAKFEERQIGGQRYNLFTGCPNGKTATIILRGGGEHFIEEADRSLHDAIMVVKRAVKHSDVVAGGGAIESELSKYLHEYSKTIAGKEQMIVAAFAKALEVIPRQLAQNAGIDSTDVINQLRKKHTEGGVWWGVDLANGGICDCMASFVWEPALVRLNALEAATEAACLILSVDETVHNPAAQDQQQGGRM
jgi:T-complex protein 1 subunit eta